MKASSVLLVTLLLLLLAASLEAEESQARVCGSVASKVEAPLAAAWGVAADFYALEKWVPSIAKCDMIPPDVRYCFSSDGSTWVKEQLVFFDESKHTLSYRILESNFGLLDYQATMNFTSSSNGCNLEWSFCMDASSTRRKATQEAYLLYGIRSLEKAAAAAAAAPVQQ